MSYISWFRKKLHLAEIILKSEFPTECPVCNEKMKYGVITDVHLRWLKIGQEKMKASYPLMVVNPYIHKFFRALWVVPAYKCERCRLAIAKWNLNRRDTTGFAKTGQKRLDSCPYCGSDMISGKIWGNRGIKWADSVGKVFFKRMRFIEPLPFNRIIGPPHRIIGLPARKCKKCGIAIVRYKPQKTWLQYVKLIGFFLLIGIIAFVIAVMIFEATGTTP